MIADTTLWHRRAILLAMAGLQAAPVLARLTRAATPLTDPFGLGIASGDPSPDGLVLWTRLVGAGGAPLEAGAVPVRYEVATDDRFRTIVRRGEGLAHPERAHSVHVELHGLPAGRPYWYRFHALGCVSETGRTRTAPHRADRLRLAVTSCQHWELGWFAAYRDIRAADPDLILQLGDYIYEQSYPDQPTVRRFGAGEPRDLAGYRARYALYRSDPDLRAAHAATPWVVTWDDHEVLNDYANLANREGVPPALFALRRAAAYQAYFEHMPIRPSLWRQLPTPTLYRAVDWGDLASLSLLDTRQYRSAPPCAAPDVARNVRLDHCADVDRPDRSILGGAQERWLGARLAREHRPWTLIAQQIFFAPLALDGSGGQVWSDQWDGYAANRRRLTDQLAGPHVRNPVILSGDIHSFWINEVRRDAGRDSGRGAPIGTEIVTSALAAQSPPAGRFGDYRANNPHIRFADVRHSGWVCVDIGRDALTGAVRAVDRTQPVGAGTTLTSFRIERDRHVQFA